ncbi:MAG TPA: transketolase C-terminal domain-containing protein [Mycobacteriales bacterium]|nr:transketolase C-terminal domain-containing protein [Mycobacteriales bacterium]
MSGEARETNYRQAVGQSIAAALEADPRVVFFGEDVAAAGGAFKTTVGLLERFGPMRVRDTPISEQAIIGTAIGAALTGLRPIAELMFADFAGVAYDQLANQLAKLRYMTGGQGTLAVTIRLSNGAGGGFGAQHSQPAENWFLNIPGLKIAVPGTVEDLFGLMQSAVDDDNPVLVFEHKNLFNLKGTLPAGRELVPLGEAAVVTEGSDVTIVATQQMRHRSADAAAKLSAEGIEACVIDPRCLVPFDDDAVVRSLETTSRLLVVQEGPPDGGWGASLVARMTTGHFELFDAPPVLLTSPATPIPYAENLENAWLPDVDAIVDAARTLVRY